MNEEIQIDAINELNYLLINYLIDLMNQCVCKCSKHLQTHNLYSFDFSGEKCISLQQSKVALDTIYHLEKSRRGLN